MTFILWLALVAVVLVLHAFLVLFENGLVQIRYGNVREDEVDLLKERKGIALLLDCSDQTGRVVRFSKTLCTVALGLFLIPLLSHVFEVLGPDPSAIRWLLVFFVFGLSVLVHFLGAEIYPRGRAMKEPAKSVQCSYRIVLLFRGITFPAMFFLRRIKSSMFARMGVEMEDEHNPLDVDIQIRALGEDSSNLSPVMRKIVDRTMQMQDLVVHDVLLPRNQVSIYDLELSFAENLKVMQAAGHTRFPLCRGGLDDCLGIVHIKDIFRSGMVADLADPLEMKRNIAAFDLETSLEDALQRMLRAKFHMALVVDEFGGVLGLVTLESILEELVGDIQDEFDSEEGLVVPLPEPDRFKLSGLAPIHDVEELLNVEIDNDTVSTIGGLVTSELGRIPAVGERLVVSGLEIFIKDVDDRRIITVYVQKA